MLLKVAMLYSNNNKSNININYLSHQRQNSNCSDLHTKQAEKVFVIYLIVGSSEEMVASKALSMTTASMSIVRLNNNCNNAIARVYIGKNSSYFISSLLLLLLLLLLKRLAMQDREREINTLSVRRPQPHTTIL